MMIPNYEILEKLAENKSVAVYKAYHKKHPERLLALKVLKEFFLSNYKISQFSQRIEHLGVLHNNLVITPIDFNIKDEPCFVTQDYFHGVPLDCLFAVQPRVPLKDFFTVACKLARALEQIHDAGIIHGGIKPHNILVNPDTLDIRLIDFISAVDVREVSHFIYDRSFVHRAVFSSDLYSLGVVFYEMLTDCLPFACDDPLEPIHSHLAEEAPGVHELNPGVPPVLGKIVSTLMLEAPEKRYQSASGLLADLARRRDEYAATGSISEFPLSLIQALRNLMRTFLTESDERVALWKDRILKAVEQNGRVLTGVIPELEILIGPQPAVFELPPVELANRFHDTFDHFLTCLASRENPLTLFIDDLQWCDAASFNFLTNIFTNYQDHPYLFFLGAYRHNEVDSSHPLTISHKEGRLTDVLYNTSVYRDVEGNVLGVFAAARDVTAQKEAEAKVAGQRAPDEQRAREFERLAELERFQKLTVGRELKMIELKKEIEELRKENAVLQNGAQGGRVTPNNVC